MSFLLIPNEVKSTTATIWIGVINEGTAFDQGTLTLTCNRENRPIPLMTPPHETSSGRNNIWHVFFEVDNLQPATFYVFELFHNNNSVSFCNTRTLPVNLPLFGERPFTVLLSSCFCSSQPGSSAIGNTYFTIPVQEKPDIKILCGDQVYLDAPALNFTFPKSNKALEDTHFANYVNTWTQDENIFGNRFFLQNGPNFFCADDHEFWNNAPDFASFLPDTFTPGGRAAWLRFASNFFRTFQTPSSTKRFDVGRVSFFIADTRVNRGPGTNNFMTPEDRDLLESWVQGLTGMGVLVIGQPIFTKGAGAIKSVIADKTLPNYEQYKDLIGILTRTPRTIVVLTGDVHYGRVSFCTLLNGQTIYEVIASPSKLVSSLAKGKWKLAPENFPAEAIEGVVNRTTTTNDIHQMTEEHFLTLAFFMKGAKVGIQIKAFKMVGLGGQAQSEIVSNIEILL